MADEFPPGERVFYLGGGGGYGSACQVRSTHGELIEVDLAVSGLAMLPI